VVANVSTFGQADRQLQVLVDPAKLAAHHVSLADVIETSGNAQLVSPLSYLEASTPGTGGFLEGPDQRITIQPVLPFGTPSNMAALPVANAPKGLRLGDVAQVVQSGPPLIGAGQVEGGTGLVLEVQKLPSANVLTVSSEVDQALAQLKPGLPGISIDTSLFREDTYLHSSLGNLRIALIVAGALVALALIALLLQLRLAFAALVGVSLSMIAAVGTLALLGYTFNALLTLGLLLALGLVVTEAAGQARTVAARISARQPGDQPLAVVAAACGELRGALCAAGVAAAGCVIPLLLATGLTASFLRPMAMAFALAVIVSLVVAVTVTPALSAFLLTVLPPPKRTPAFGAAFGRRLAGRYAGWIGVLARTPRLAMVCAAASFAVGLAGLALLPFLHPGQPTFTDRELVVRLTGPPGMSLTELDRMTALSTTELRALPQVQNVGATLGRAVTSEQVVNTNTGELWVTIKPDADYGQAVAAVSAIADGTPGLAGAVSTNESNSMTGVLAAPPAKVVTRIYGLDYGELARLAGQLRPVIAGIGGVHGTQVQLPVEQPTIDVQVNLDAAALADVTPGDVRREAGTLLSGLTVGNYFENQQVFDVVVWGSPAVRDSVSSIENLLLDTNNGGHVRLGSVAQISIAPQPADIPQEAMARYVDISAAVSGGQAGAVSNAIEQRIQAMHFPIEYHAELVTGTTAAGLSPNGAAVAGTSRMAFVGYLVAVLAAIFLIFQAVTGSWRLAGFAFASLPVSLAGGALVVFALGADGDLAASAGLLAVFALAVRQAIAVMARVHSTAGAGADGPPAVAETLLPEILTPALVTAVVLVPFIVLGDVPGLELLHTAAAVILGGLVTCTLVNLFVLPVADAMLGPVLADLTDSPDAAGGATSAADGPGQIDSKPAADADTGSDLKGDA
jgi:multidrug efflux pump subunit AcrB